MEVKLEAIDPQSLRQDAEGLAQRYGHTAESMWEAIDRGEFSGSFVAARMTSLRTALALCEP